MNAQEDYADKTKIFLPNHQYTIIQLCHEGRPDFIVPGQLVTDQNDSIERITSGAFSALEKLEQDRKNNEPCNASAKSLVQLSTNLNDAASKAQGKTNKMIVLLQAPWSWEDVDKVFPALKEGMSKLAKTKKFEKIFLFGVSTQGTDKLSQAFEKFNQDKESELRFWEREEAIVLPSIKIGQWSIQSICFPSPWSFLNSAFDWFLKMGLTDRAEFREGIRCTRNLRVYVT